MRSIFLGKAWYALSLSLSMLCIFACFFVLCCFFLESILKKKSFRNTIIVSNSKDPDLARHFVGPDLGPNCLQSLSADDFVVTSR